MVDKPEPKPQPQPKVESQPIAKPEPQSVPQPEPVPAQTPEPSAKAPEPVKAQTAPAKPKPAPKEVLTSPNPAPSQPIVSAPVEGSSQPTAFSNSSISSSSSVTEASSSSSSQGTPGNVAVSSGAPPRPESSSVQGISCVDNCEPEYPAALEGTEGSAGVKLTISSNGNVIGAELAEANSDSQLNRQALLAARKMKFDAPPGGDSASVRVRIDFTVAGSEYDRAARQEQRERERQTRERREQEAARQQQLEQERQARQEQLERERQARQEQLEQQIESQPQQPAATPPAESKPMPAPAETEVDDEMLRKFRDRIEQHQQE